MIPDEVIVLTEYNNCLLGYTDQEQAVYSKEKIIEAIIENYKLSYEDALDYAYVNIFNAYIGEKTPIYVNEIE